MCLRRVVGELTEGQINRLIARAHDGVGPRGQNDNRQNDNDAAPPMPWAPGQFTPQQAQAQVNFQQMFAQFPNQPVQGGALAQILGGLPGLPQGLGGFFQDFFRGGGGGMGGGQ